VRDLDFFSQTFRSFFNPLQPLLMDEEDDLSLSKKEKRKRGRETILQSKALHKDFEYFPPPPPYYFFRMRITLLVES